MTNIIPTTVYVNTAQYARLRRRWAELNSARARRALTVAEQHELDAIDARLEQAETRAQEKVVEA